MYKSEKITADWILDTIKEIECVREDSFFVINNDESFSKTVEEAVVLNKQQRTSLQIEDKSGNFFVPSLFQDRVLWNNLKSINTKYDTSKIKEKTPFRLLKRILNKLIRFNVRQQVDYNMSVTQTINSLTENLKDIGNGISIIQTEDAKRFQGKYSELAQRINVLENQCQNLNVSNILLKNEYENAINFRVSDIEEKVSELQTGSYKYAEITNSELRDEIERLKLRDTQVEKILDENGYNNALQLKDIEGLKNWIRLIDEKYYGTEKWIQLLDDKIDSYVSGFNRLRKEMFYEINHINNSDNIIMNNTANIEKRIIDKAKYNEKLLNMNNDIKLNLGVGMKGEADYINIDARELPGVDIICDIRKLPFTANEISEIKAEHLIEHFTLIEFENDILPNWFNVLKVGGKLRLVTPNIEQMSIKLYENEISFDEFREVVFGGQEYVGNYHYNMFSTNSLTTSLAKSGFSKIEIVDACRRNGMCFEMELIAVK